MWRPGMSSSCCVFHLMVQLLFFLLFSFSVQHALCCWSICTPTLFPFAVFTSFQMRKKNPQVITALTYRRMSLSCEVDCVTPRFTGLKHYLYTCLDYLNIWLTYAWSWQLCGNSFLLLNKESVCRWVTVHLTWCLCVSVSVSLCVPVCQCEFLVVCVQEDTTQRKY